MFEKLQLWVGEGVLEAGLNDPMVLGALGLLVFVLFLLVLALMSQHFTIALLKKDVELLKRQLR